MTTVREDILEALREYEEEERKRLQEEALRKAEEELEERRREEEERQRQEEEERQRQEQEENEREEEEKEEIVQKAYEHLRQDDIEGYSQTPYCDSEGKNTVGVGYRIPNYNAIKDLTLTSQNAPVSPDNPAWDEDKKKDFIQKLNAFCKNKDNWKNSLEQSDKYYKKYGESMPYFNQDELENLSKDYIRNTALPEAEKNLSQLNMDFYKDLSPDAQTGMLDMQYNLGGNKFKLINLYNPDQIDKSNLKYKNELKADPNAYLKKEIRNDLIENKYWPGLSMSLMNRDTSGVQNNLHRNGVGEGRHKVVQNLFANPWRENSAIAAQDTGTDNHMGQNVMLQNNLGQAGGLSQNPYGNIDQLQRDKEDLEELLRRLKLLQSRWR